MPDVLGRSTPSLPRINQICPGRNWKSMAFFTVDACAPGVGALNVHGPGGVGGGRAGSDSFSRKPDTPHSPDAEGSEGAERPRELTGEAEKGN